MKPHSWPQTTPLRRSHTSKQWCAGCPSKRCADICSLKHHIQIEQIMLAPNESFCVSSLAALREVSNLKSNMTKTQAEVVLGSFVSKGWLVKSRYATTKHTSCTYSYHIGQCQERTVFFVYTDEARARSVSQEYIRRRRY